MLKPINPSPFNTYITKDKHETIECEMPKNQKIIGDYTRIVDVETSEVVFDAYSQYEDNPKSIIKYENVLSGEKANYGKEYYWNTFYWSENNDSNKTKYYTAYSVEENSNKIAIIDEIDSDRFIFAFKTAVICINNSFDDLQYGKYYFELGDDWYDEDGYDLRWGKDFPKYYKNRYDFMEYREIEDCLLVAIEAIEQDYDSENDKFMFAAKYGMSKQPVLDKNDNYKVITVSDVKSYYNYNAARVFFDNENFYNTLKNYNSPYIVCLCSKGDMSSILKSLITVSFETDDSQTVSYRYCLTNSTYNGYVLECGLYPNAQTDIPSASTVTITELCDGWNISPDYYFRCKAEPTILINSTSKIKEVPETTDLGDITKNKLYDIESDFKVTFKPGENCTGMNYYQLHYYIKSDNDDYVLVEKSNKLFPDDAGYSYKGFVNGGSYKVVAICVDNDGDEWTEELCFDVSYDIKNSGNIINCVRFDEDDYSIKVNIENMISESFGKENDNVSVLPYSFKIYKQRKGYLFADYVGECSSWSPKLTDHNIQNDMNYTYFLKVAKKVEDDGSDLDIEGIYNIGEITPVFVGSCIMGLKKTSDNTYQVARVFYLNYHFNDCMHESTQELIRDYSGTFGKYQQEIKGSANYLTGVAEGLLGYEVDGGYTEPNNIKNDWLEFINDDSLKLYKGMDGNTMLVSITTSKIKPRYYEEYGLVNEVNISYKQIGDTNNIAIYDLEV